MTAREWTLPLAFLKPLSMNDPAPISRGGRMARHRVVKQWRQHAKDLATAAGIPMLDRFTAVLHWQPRTNNRRDPENYFAAVKPLVDGLVDAGVARDDNAKYYRPTVPEIHPAKRGEPGRMWLVVQELTGEPGQTALNLTPEGD